MRKVLLVVGAVAFSSLVVVFGTSVGGERAARAAGDPVLVGAGDIASCNSSGDGATARLLDGISGTVFTVGDNVYQLGTASEFDNCYAPTWGRHKARTRPAVGNHEYNTSGAAPYYAYFGVSAGPAGKGYYSYERGEWHIVVLNSNCSKVACAAGSAQERWLRADLDAHPAKCTLAYFHHPRFHSGKYGSINNSVSVFWKDLYAAGAEVVLNGHAHNYERYAPQKPNGTLDRARGIREFVVGTGGVEHDGFGAVRPHSQVRNANTYGVLKLRLHAESYGWKFIPQAGKTFTDSGTKACH